MEKKTYQGQDKELQKKLQQDVLDKKLEDLKKEEYGEYVKQITPKRNLAVQMGKAFLVGGIFCVIGQFLTELYMCFGLDKDMAGTWCSVSLILLSAVLTAFSFYQKIANFGGAGALVPITGFANSVCATAIEYQPEGQVFGVGVKIFTIAGPVILYGIFTSWVLGLLYWMLKVFGV